MTSQWLAVIGSLLGLGIMFLKWRSEKATKNQEEIYAADKKIDSASNADDIMRHSGELRS